MAQRISRKQLKQDEFIEAAWSLEQWVEENWRLLLKWIVAIVVLFAVVLGWLAWSRHSRLQDREQLASAVAAYEKAKVDGVVVPADLETALESLKKIRGGTSGRVARFYEGAALLDLGRHDEAAASLEDVSGSLDDADTLGVTSQAMLARVYIEAGRNDDAIALLTKLIDSSNPSVPTAQMLLMLGRVQQQVGRDAEAQAAFQRIVDEFPQGAAAIEARELIDS